MKYEKEGKGNLGFLLFWQSLDGRPKFVDYGLFKDAKNHYDHLKITCGRKPMLYHMVIMK